MTVEEERDRLAFQVDALLRGKLRLAERERDGLLLLLTGVRAALSQQLHNIDTELERWR